MTIKNIGIIGYGSIGQKHHQILASLSDEFQFSILTQQKGVLNSFSTLESFSTLDLDYIIISNATSLHYESLKFLDERYKKIKFLIEKPLFHNVQSFDGQSNLYLVGYNLRFHQIIDEFIKLLKKNISKIKIGDPTNNSTDVGPLIRPSEVIRIDGVVKKAIKDGAELICGGSKETETSYKCTVLKNPKESSEISKNEIFGPVLCIYSYKEINDAINKANHDEYAFQTSIYTNNIETALLCYEKLDAKSVFVNEQTAFRVDWMPFGGIKNSGEGTGGIEYSFSDLLYDKMIVLNSKKITT